MTKDLAALVKAQRVKLGYTFREIERLAKKKVTHAAIYQIEVGKHKSVDPHKLRVLCEVLEIDFVEAMILAGYITKSEIRMTQALGRKPYQ